MKNRKRIAGIICFVLAVGLFAGMGFAVSSAGEFSSRALRAQGTVVEMVTRTTYHPVIEFVSDSGTSHRFESIHGSRPPEYRVGERVTVLYDPASPSTTARLDTVMGVGFLAILTGGLGGLFLVLGLVLIVAPALSGARDRSLKQHGVRVEATVTAVEESPLSPANGPALYRVAAEYSDPQTGMKQFFNSRDLDDEPTVSVGETISVYVDPDDENKYFVEIPAAKLKQ